MKRAQAVLGVIALLVIGIFIGAVGTYSLALMRLERVLEHPKSVPYFLMNRIARKLDLDEDQRKKLKEVLQKTRPRLIEIRRSVSPQVAEVFNDAERDISVFLRPDQKERFGKIIERRKKFFNKMSASYPDDPPGEEGKN